MLTLSLIRQSAATERIRGVSAAARIDDPPSEIVGALIATLGGDPSVNVRLACVRALERFSSQPAVREGVIHAVTREASPLVSMALIEFIVETRDQSAVDALRLVSRDMGRDEAVRDAATRGFERLLGEGRL